MFLLIVAFPGKTEYYGPFINEERAEEYGRACKAQLEGVEDAWVKPLNTPAREHSITLRRVE